MKQLVVSIAAVVSLVSPVVAHADKNFLGGKGATWDCKQDPVVNINHGHGVYTLKGSCKAINLAGGNNTLTIASSEALNINGGKNTIAIDAVDEINIVGADNTVTYKAALHGDAPRISKLGNNNTVGSTKAADGGGKPADGGKPAPARKPSDAGAQDCARSPTGVINTGDGNYKFVGPCTRIAINGGGNTVSIESVEALAINGGDNTVSIGSADKINVNGNDNKVSYRAGISGAKPKVVVLGEHSQVTQVK
jgi:hypothetical protein